MAAARDPYTVLGVSSSAPDAELRAAYHRLVQLHHPDHNGGSSESARRFEEVQEAYAAVRQLRQNPAGATPRRATTYRATDATPASADPSVESRLAAMERELQAARAAREHAVRQARAAREQAIRAARQAAPSRQGTPSDEDLGYISTDDSFSKILDDAAAELSERLTGAKHSPAGRRVADLIDELSTRLAGERRDGD